MREELVNIYIYTSNLWIIGTFMIHYKDISSLLSCQLKCIECRAFLQGWNREQHGKLISAVKFIHASENENCILIPIQYSCPLIDDESSHSSVIGIPLKAKSAPYTLANILIRIRSYRPPSRRKMPSEEALHYYPNTIFSAELIVLTA